MVRNLNQTNLDTSTHNDLKKIRNTMVNLIPPYFLNIRSPPFRGLWKDRHDFH